MGDPITLGSGQFRFTPTTVVTAGADYLAVRLWQVNVRVGPDSWYHRVIGRKLRNVLFTTEIAYAGNSFVAATIPAKASAAAPHTAECGKYCTTLFPAFVAQALSITCRLRTTPEYAGGLLKPLSAIIDKALALNLVPAGSASATRLVQTQGVVGAIYDLLTAGQNQGVTDLSIAPATQPNRPMLEFPRYLLLYDQQHSHGLPDSTGKVIPWRELESRVDLPREGSGVVALTWKADGTPVQTATFVLLEIAGQKQLYPTREMWDGAEEALRARVGEFVEGARKEYEAATTPDAKKAGASQLSRTLGLWLTNDRTGLSRADVSAIVRYAIEDLTGDGSGSLMRSVRPALTAITRRLADQPFTPALMTPAEDLRAALEVVAPARRRAASRRLK